jgi:hypothetical protein
MARLARKRPTPVAFCWYLGIDMSIKNIKEKGCRDPEKQKNPDGICKHLQTYGERKVGDEIGKQVVQSD